VSAGGHVGPRSSFALWDAQVETLLRYGASLTAEHEQRFIDELHLLFAGGIHDERSAAMAAVLAAPLAARGAGIGVLMGTAYLFTEEAVQAGAIVPAFQQAALACETTVLAGDFGGTRDALRADALRPYLRRDEAPHASPRGGSADDLDGTRTAQPRPPASGGQGLRRSGEHIVAVAESEQRTEGMVMMIGQIAALRSATTTINALHHQVTAGAAAFLDEAAARLTQHEETSAPPALDVAIVGMASIFPKAPDLEQYWANILGGIDAITEVPIERWDPSVHWDPQSTGMHAGRRTPLEAGRVHSRDSLRCAGLRDPAGVVDRHRAGAVAGAARRAARAARRGLC